MTASSVRAKPSRKSISLHVLRARLIRIRPVSSTRVSTETHAARSTSTKEKKLTSPPSRRSFAKRSPSTILASRNLRRKRSPKGFRPEQVRHRGGGGVLPPERTQVEDGLDSRKERGPGRGLHGGAGRGALVHGDDREGVWASRAGATSVEGRGVSHRPAQKGDQRPKSC